MKELSKAKVLPQEASREEVLPQEASREDGLSGSGEVQEVTVPPLSEWLVEAGTG